MTLQFENASNADIPVIFSQAKDLIDTYEDLESIDYERVMDWVNRKITQNISQYTAVICDGVKCAYFRQCEDGELDDLYVLPAFQNLGIGTQIMEKCIKETKKPLFLYVFSRNTGAIAFYGRCGFTVHKTVGNTRLIMVRNS